ncbi:MAG TPA: nucleotidyltransferase family protein [Pyrinomonadaceae bacterium]
MTKTEDPRPKTSDVSAIILAAGRSQRMGAFKPLLPFGPTTVIETCIENLRAGGVETIVVVLGQDSRAEGLKKHLKNTGVSFAVNPDSNSEMSASIACGVCNLPEETRAVIINPVDHAAVPVEIIETLISEWKKGAQLVKPTWKGSGGHPVLIDLSFRDELLSLDPTTGLKTFFSAHQQQVSRVPVDSNYIARDMDTWDDYRALHTELFGVQPPESSSRERIVKQTTCDNAN